MAWVQRPISLSLLQRIQCQSVPFVDQADPEEVCGIYLLLSHFLIFSCFMPWWKVPVLVLDLELSLRKGQSLFWRGAGWQKWVLP
jgi:hypothetical protein